MLKLLIIKIIKDLIVRAQKIFNKLRFFYRPLKYTLIITLSVFVLILGFLIFWYNYCFFPYDQDYLQQISDSVKYKGNALEEKETDLIREIGQAKFDRPLSRKDRDFLLSADFKGKDINIDINPYYSNHPNNLKYSTGKTFYYIYQKDSLVLKANSRASYSLKNSGAKKRFLELDAVLPELEAKDSAGGFINIYYISDNRKILLKKDISPERKPDIKPFRYSSVLSSISFYLQHPGRSVLTDNTGWEKIRIDLPSTAGTLEIEFKSAGKASAKQYLFIGSPAVYSVNPGKRDGHVNIVYLIFDTLSKSHIDLYEHYNTFKKKKLAEAYSELGNRRIITPVIDEYADRICLFENMFTVGQVTRPAIVPLWTSQIYTKSRLPVFRNIVTDENQREFNSLHFASLGNELSKHGYFTKQISCNAQGHAVSGVGVDLGFNENYDYTMEATEKPENFRRIIEFLNENQNRKFFLYSHINVPHPPKWIPMSYFLSALPDMRFNIELAKMLGNIRYLNDSLGKVMKALEKLKLTENTIVIITADHSGGRIPYLRGEFTGDDIKSASGDSQSVATFHSRSIYGREGGQHLLNLYMNIPWILIKPLNTKFIPGKINSYISSLDIAPTLLDITINKSNEKFSGRSFKNLLVNKDERDKVFSGFIPLTGRFQRGFVTDGRYKYWINLVGLYKYRIDKDKKYIMQQEYLYDLKNDPNEINNLAHETFNNDLLKRMRHKYFEQFTDYPDKNFIQISASPNGFPHNYKIQAVSANGKIIYPKTYGEGITYLHNQDNEISFTCEVKDKPAFFSFETDPSDSQLTIRIYKDDKLVTRSNIYSSVECINYFDNPIILNDKIDFHIAREQGKTGLEVKDIPHGSVNYSRIPLNYWMEMNMSDKDIRLSPGIKEVLRGWGYIQ
ncbi:MAG: sulfatase-like hydrolase/transferase [Spirochaetota bacterium]